MAHGSLGSPVMSFTHGNADEVHGMKNPLVVQGVVRDAQVEGASCPKLVSIVDNILRLRGIEV